MANDDRCSECGSGPFVLIQPELRLCISCGRSEFRCDGCRFWHPVTGMHRTEDGEFCATCVAGAAVVTDGARGTGESEGPATAAAERSAPVSDFDSMFNALALGKRSWEER